MVCEEYIKAVKRLVTTEYTLRTDKRASLRIAHISDLHGASGDDALLRINDVDMICVTGDGFDGDDYVYGLRYKLCGGGSIEELRELSRENALSFLKRASAIAPTYYSMGNHEGELSRGMKNGIKKTGTRLLDNQYVEFPCLYGAGVLVGGLSDEPDFNMLNAFCAHETAYKILLCHHPEYYPPYLADRDIDLILSGHAHGGQARFFGQGLFAPGQGLFPRLTAGVKFGRMVISRGIGNAVFVPRIFNPPEVVIVNIQGVN